MSELPHPTFAEFTQRSWAWPGRREQESAIAATVPPVDTRPGGGRPITEAEAEAAVRCLDRGGVIIFGVDTVYGLACRPGAEPALARIRALKGRDENKPMALMAFSMTAAMPLIRSLPPRTRAAVIELFPSPMTLILPPLAPGEPPLGLRVPWLMPECRELATIPGFVVQTSANISGEPAVARFEQIDARIRDGVDLAFDVGRLRGKPSAVADLSRYESDGTWSYLRPSKRRLGRLVEVLGVPPDNVDITKLGS